MGLENVAQDCGLDLENRAQNRIFLGGIMLYLFWGNVPPFFLFLQVVGGVLFFFPRKHGGYTMFEIFSEIVWYSYLVVVCMYV